MEQIDLAQYMTIAELREELECGQRSVWRVIDRVGREKCCIRFLNATLVRRSMLEELRSHYYPYYSEAHQARVKEWGAAGGQTKAKNMAGEMARRRAEAAAKPKRPRGRPKKNAQ